MSVKFKLQKFPGKIAVTKEEWRLRKTIAERLRFEKAAGVLIAWRVRDCTSGITAPATRLYA